MNRWSSILTHTAAAMSCILSHCHQSHDSYHSALDHDDWVKNGMELMPLLIMRNCCSTFLGFKTHISSDDGVMLFDFV